MVRIQNSSKRAEHLCKIKFKNPRCLNVTIESEGCQHVYGIDIQPRDLLVPVYKSASLFWVKLLYGMALKSETEMVMSFLTADDLKVNQIFLREKMNVHRSVKEELAYGVLMEVTYTV